jgi:hypothetical protein
VRRKVAGTVLIFCLTACGGDDDEDTAIINDTTVVETLDTASAAVLIDSVRVDPSMTDTTVVSDKLPNSDKLPTKNAERPPRPSTRDTTLE